LPEKGTELWTNIPVLALLTVNIIPLIGVIFLKFRRVRKNRTNYMYFDT